jgi:hypothetical protein
MRKRILMVALATAGMTVGYATPAAAQATRTWVSGVGDDVNPCSRTAPCKTFAGAISKTAAGGEINCLDPGGFGAVTITKSMTIDCHYTEGGALAGGNGITINDSLTATPGTAVVVLRGLDIFGVSPPSNGVRFVSGATLIIEDSVIRRFNAANSVGVSFAPLTPSELYIYNTTISGNGNGATGGGIEIKPGANATGNARAVLKNVRVIDNANNGFRVDTTGNSHPGISVRVTITDSDFSGNTNGIVGLDGGSDMSIMIEGSQISNNSGTGITASGAGVQMRVADLTITGNNVGVSTPGGIISSYGTSRNNGNISADGAFTGAIFPQQ